MTFAQISPRDWGKKIAYIIGGGPSLRGFDFSKIQGYTMGVNEVALKLNTDAVFSLDHNWIKNRKSELDRFQGEKIFALAPNSDFNVHGINNATHVLWVREDGISTDVNEIHGLNSGFGALNALFLLGCKRIALMGFDMGHADGQAHWFKESYPWGTSPERIYNQWIRDFNESAAVLIRHGVQIYNVGLTSKLECFVKIDLESLEGSI